MAQSDMSPFQFLNNRIIHLEMANHVSDFSDPRLEREIYKLDYYLSGVLETEGQWVGSLVMTIELGAELEEEPAYRLSLAIEGGFAGPVSQLTKKEFTDLVELNGLTTLYSIARGVIISVSAQCGAEGQIRLPMVNLYGLYLKKHEGEGTERQPS